MRPDEAQTVDDAADLARGPGEVVRLADRMVPMADGILLAADVYLPAEGAGPWPVLMERTPYGKRLKSEGQRPDQRDDQISRAQYATAFASHGFAVVVQDVRGRHGSEGVFTKYVHEAQDGLDTHRWIVAQPWCDGRIGTYGQSYAAHTQLAAAALEAPGLACMFLECGGFWNAYRAGIRQGGAFELKQLTWAFTQARQSPEAQRDPVLKAALEAEDIRDWLGWMPWIEGQTLLRHVPAYEAYVFDEWRRGTFDDSWRQPGLWGEGYWHVMPKMPIQLMCSWYDPYVSTTLANFAGLRRAGNERVWLIMGPSIHCARNLTFAGDVEFGPAARFDGNLATDFFTYRLHWFRHWLQNAQGETGLPRVRYFVMGGGSGRRTDAGRLDHGGAWMQADDWPPSDAVSAWYLHQDGGLHPEPPSVEESSIVWRADPRDPVPAIGGNITSGRPVMEGGAFDQVERADLFGCKAPGRPLAARADVLAFQSGILAEDVVLAGPIRARLWVSSDSPDTDITVKLVDVHPPTADDPKGFAMNLCDGILRLRYRNSWERPALLEPDRIYEIEVELFATANRFKVGHRIRVDIASSKFPQFDVNPNSGEPEGQGRAWRVATNRLWLDRSHPSHVVLPTATPGRPLNARRSP